MPKKIKVLNVDKTNVEILSSREKCNSRSCTEPPTVLVLMRGGVGEGSVHAYCAYHAARTLEVDSPEYTSCCPNCGCKMGVN